MFGFVLDHLAFLNLSDKARKNDLLNYDLNRDT